MREIAAAALGATRLHQILKSPEAAEVAERLSVLPELEWPAPEMRMRRTPRLDRPIQGTSIVLHSAGASGRDQHEKRCGGAARSLVRLLGASSPAAGTLLSGFVRLPPLVAVLQLADYVLHRDPDRLGRRKRRGLVASGRRRWQRWRRRHVLGGRGDGSGREEQPRAQGPQDEAGS
jgi:hypothetical protein